MTLTFRTACTVTPCRSNHLSGHPLRPWWRAMTCVTKVVNSHREKRRRRRRALRLSRSQGAPHPLTRVTDDKVVQEQGSRRVYSNLSSTLFRPTLYPNGLTAPLTILAVDALSPPLPLTDAAEDFVGADGGGGAGVERTAVEEEGGAAC